MPTTNTELLLLLPEAASEQQPPVNSGHILGVSRVFGIDKLDCISLQGDPRISLSELQIRMRYLKWTCVK